MILEEKQCDEEQGKYQQKEIVTWTVLNSLPSSMVDERIELSLVLAMNSVEKRIHSLKSQSTSSFMSSLNRSFTIRSRTILQNRLWCRLWMNICYCRILKRTCSSYSFPFDVQSILTFAVGVVVVDCCAVAFFCCNNLVNILNGMSV